ERARASQATAQATSSDTSRSQSASLRSSRPGGGFPFRSAHPHPKTDGSTDTRLQVSAKPRNRSTFVESGVDGRAPDGATSAKAPLATRDLAEIVDVPLGRRGAGTAG